MCVLLGQVPWHRHSLKSMSSARGEVLLANFNKAFLISNNWVTREELMLLFLLLLEVNSRAAGCGATLPLGCECSWLTQQLLVE